MLDEVLRKPRRPIPGSPSASYRSTKSVASSRVEAGPSKLRSELPNASDSRDSFHTTAADHGPSKPSTKSVPRVEEPLPELSPTPSKVRVGTHESNDSKETSNSNTSPRANSDGWNERKLKVPRSNLTVLDVAALIINKMVSGQLAYPNMELTNSKIGTGIFTTPGTVLASTRSKGMSVALWTVGGLWTALLYVYTLRRSSCTNG